MQPYVRKVELLRIARIGIDPGVVPGALADLVIVIDPRPLVAAIIAAIEPAALRFDDRPHPARLRRGSRDADLAEQALGQSFGQLLPGVAAVERAPQPAALAAAHQLP